MATQLISFRASGEFLKWLESQQQEGETLNLTAQRILKGVAGTPSTTVSTLSTPLSTVSSTLSTDKIEVLVNEKLATAIGERLTGIEERLGKLRA